MNVIVPLNKDDPTSFWIVIAAIAILAVAIVAVARTKRWL
jgi:Mg2+ and Co2+ transporter CorA